jgi:hypothetical protein
VSFTVAPLPFAAGVTAPEIENVGIAAMVKFAVAFAPLMVTG